MGCTLLIKECLNSLTETEQRLGCYLLDHTSEVIHMNAKEYASACASSRRRWSAFPSDWASRALPP